MLMAMVVEAVVPVSTVERRSSVPEVAEWLVLQSFGSMRDELCRYRKWCCYQYCCMGL